MLSFHIIQLRRYGFVIFHPEIHILKDWGWERVMMGNAYSVFPNFIIFLIHHLIIIVSLPIHNFLNYFVIFIDLFIFFYFFYKLFLPFFLQTFLHYFKKFWMFLRNVYLSEFIFLNVSVYSLCPWKKVNHRYRSFVRLIQLRGKSTFQVPHSTVSCSFTRSKMKKKNHLRYFTEKVSFTQPLLLQC